MSMVKRLIEQKQKTRQKVFCQEMYSQIEAKVLELVSCGVKKSDLYKLLRKYFVERGWKPFDVMTYYQTWCYLQKGKEINEAFEAGYKTAAMIAAKTKRR